MPRKNEKKKEKKKILTWKRLLGGLGILTISSALGFYLFTDYHLNSMYGGHTNVAKIDVNTLNDRPDEFAIANIRILSPNSETFSEPQSVIIKDGLIYKLSADDSALKDILNIDGTGKYLVPGYTDSHVHLWESENDLPLFIANGVTQIREMNGSKENLNWRDEIKAGRLGPDIFVTSPQLANFGKSMGWFQAWTQRKRNATSEAKFKSVVKSLEADGYDAIKASSFLDSEDYTHLNTAMQGVEIPLIGHIPYFAKLEDFWKVEQTSVAHIEEFVKPLRKEFKYRSENADQFVSFVRDRSPDIAERLAERGVAVTTTFALIRDLPDQITNLDAMLSASELKFVNPGISEGAVITDRALGWLPDVNRYRFQPDWTDEQKQEEVEYFQNYAQAMQIMLQAMIEADVQIVTGTDTNVPVIVPGFSIHQEMQAMSAAGMTNAQVLASTTRIPSDWMGWKTGQIAEGYKANLVLLNANPLENIQATDDIDMVIVNGLPLNKGQLNSLLTTIEAANDESRKVSIQNWQ